MSSPVAPAPPSTYEEAFARAPIGMALIGLDSRFLDVNDALCAIAGRSRDELIGLPFEAVTHPDDVGQDFAQAIEIMRGERDVFMLEKRYLRPDGAVRWVDVGGSLIRDEAGAPLHFAFHIQDITDRKQAERVKDEFLATISHELRTPLTAIQGYIDLLTDVDDLSAGVRHNAVSVIQRNAERLRRLVDDVQFIAQARADALPLRREAVQLDRLVCECADFAASRAVERGLELTVRVEPVALKSADADRLSQAIDHLLANALTYTESGGRVEVRLSRNGSDAIFEVADTGVGLSDDDRAQLFERFFRASSAVDGALPGVGLGLSIVEAIVELHGGRVEVDSALGRGSTFAVRLPLAR